MSSSVQPGRAISIEGERRAHRRYALELDLSYVVHTGNRITMSGSGRCSNVSSGGLLFHPAGPIEEGGTVVAAIRWPMISTSGEPLLLVVSGRVVWSVGDRAALALTRHEFLPESQYRPHDLASLLPLRMIPTRAGVRRNQARLKPGRPMILVVDGDDREGILAKLLESYGYAVQYTDRRRAIEVLGSGVLEVSVLITNNMQGLERFAEAVPMILTAGDVGSVGPGASFARRVIAKPLVLRQILKAVQELGGQSQAGAVPNSPV
jgi:hypothetical protein